MCTNMHAYVSGSVYLYTYFGGMYLLECQLEVCVCVVAFLSVCLCASVFVCVSVYLCVWIYIFTHIHFFINK